MNPFEAGCQHGANRDPFAAQLREEPVPSVRPLRARPRRRLADSVAPRPRHPDISRRNRPPYGSFLWTCWAFSAATWAFLIGGFLPYVGDWRLGVIGYVIGLVIGMSIVALASGASSYKYGTDVIDNAKSSFGYRGMVVPLLGLLATLVGWSYVVEALTSRGAANIVATVSGADSTGGAHEKLVVALASPAYRYSRFAHWRVSSGTCCLPCYCFPVRSSHSEPSGCCLR